MKATKFKNGIVILKTGERIPVKAPQYPLTEDVFKRLAYHFARVKKEDVSEVLVTD